MSKGSGAARGLGLQGVWGCKGSGLQEVWGCKVYGAARGLGCKGSGLQGVWAARGLGWAWFGAVTPLPGRAWFGALSPLHGGRGLGQCPHCLGAWFGAVSPLPGRRGLEQCPHCLGGLEGSALINTEVVICVLMRLLCCVEPAGTGNRKDLNRLLSAPSDLGRGLEKQHRS